MPRRRHDHEHDLHRDERVKLPLDPEEAIRALIATGEPDPDPRRENERKRKRTKPEKE
jgi:hypothetical protein